MIRRLTIGILALIAAGGWLISPSGVAEVRAATPDLTIVSGATYDVQPDHHRVRVTLDMTLVNHLHDTRTKRFYFDRAVLVVPPGASGAKLTWAGAGSPRAVITHRSKTSTTIQLDLAQRLYSGRSAAYRLVFEIVDPGGASTRAVRIGSSLVRFPVWAFATNDTSGSTVRVVFPTGFQVTVASGDIPAPTTDQSGQTVFQTGRLKTPLTFFAYLVADRPGATTVRVVQTTVASTPVALSIRSWADDPAWSKRVGSLVRRALPLLAERIGLAWPRDGGLVVSEALGRSTGGYAGLFDPVAGTIDVAYDAADEVVVHESAHAWFNGGLLADRWANEGFASYYALDAATDLKVKVDPATDALTPEIDAARIPLNAWGPVGKVDRATEDYGYAASLELARAIATRAGPDALRAVWSDAAAGIGAYQPITPGDARGSAAGSAGPPETVNSAPDWRGLLDLLEERTGTSFTDLWRTWIARDSDLALIDQRTAARARYVALLSTAGDWPIPRAVRDALRAWRFDDAMTLMADVEGVLASRNEITARATAIGLSAPETLHKVYAQPDGVAAAAIEARAEMLAIDRYAAAQAARPSTPGMFEEIGLWGSDPDSDLARSRTQFAAGDLSDSTASSASAAAAWSGAAELGRGRAISLVVLFVAILFAVVLAGAAFRGRRRRRRADRVVWPDLRR